MSRVLRFCAILNTECRGPWHWHSDTPSALTQTARVPPSQKVSRRPSTGVLESDRVVRDSEAPESEAGLLLPQM
eukprot:760758-Hanusia_phi.AAC.2